MHTQLLDYLACPNCETEKPFDVQANASQDDGDIVSENDEGWALQVNGAALLTPPSTLFCSHF